ncbi:ArsR/SmtB family transcription factor [Agaribacter marinus]|uniref:Transcriptional regulator n=1 Tax=Agaribacter marinus TaxID=1431249 RepID=A0AA37WJ88_9ALTE|nr:metalloregulator ArsR/SmtB family transcription factor [Agaribacter marinus]GLR72991.1 transcriptional regulator [Agaribacter marinus]
MGSLDQTFHALGDETRRTILAQLLNGEASVSELANQHDMTLTGVSNHLRVLNEAGLVRVEKRGRTRHCRIEPMVLKEASDWLDDYRCFWVRQLDNMAHVLKGIDE